MVDRDALAVEYASQNALLNGIDDDATCGSLGLDDVEERDFDLIAANIPGKASRGVISSWLRDAPLFVREQGQIAVVIVSALESFVGKTLEGMDGVDIVVRQRRAGHTAFVCSVRRVRDPLPSPSKSFDRGDYDRAQATFSHGRIQYGLRTVFGLPQFDSLSYQTRLLSNVLQSLDRRPDRVLVLNPGQGHVPVILSRALAPTSIVMFDRDLLALRCSERNLLLDGYDASGISIKHQLGLADGEAKVRSDRGGNERRRRPRRHRGAVSASRRSAQPGRPNDRSRKLRHDHAVEQPVQEGASGDYRSPQATTRQQRPGGGVGFVMGPTPTSNWGSHARRRPVRMAQLRRVCLPQRQNAVRLGSSRRPGRGLRVRGAPSSAPLG